ncbi:hypothetical protein B0T16DRAFT_438959 [Cercophora newfieldiana]|uniref:NDT80 domain-containing protein n=1 Tax=Cercophora newfieldiana TaxID=92897 RepID=A0AA39XX53_9PEZI|nr:hypothetical protein B0T16DRAFT_438959 [Cercophora newfieldiana]
MASFNSLPSLSTGATQGAAGGIDAFDADLGFDESMLVNDGLSTLPFTPANYDFDAFSTTFEDPFSYTTRPYDVGHGHGHVHGLNIANGITAPHGGYGHSVVEHDQANGDDDGASPQELDNKLLGFGAPIPGKAVIVDETGQLAEPAMTAELYGMFFVAEDVFGDAAHNTGRPLELTCYRRNLWQCSGQITLPRHVAHCVDDQGRQAPVVDVFASISAVESIEGKATEIISIPWKSNNPVAAGGDDSKAAPGSTSPPNVPLDLSSGQELEGGNVSLSVSWKRLQFKHATANNGRRKGLQQHYVVQINLFARTKSGDVIKICEIQSGPVIVRGRSPRNFDSRKDVPLTGDKKLERRSVDTGLSVGGAKQPQVPQQLPQQDLSQNIQRYHSLGNLQQSDWPTTPNPFSTQNTNLPPAKKMAVSPNVPRPPVPSWDSNNSNNSSNSGRTKFASPPTKAAQAGPGILHRATSSSSATLPINLSLSEDERSPNRSSTSGDGVQSPQFVGMKSTGSAAGGQAAGNQAHGPNGSPLETADMLYEYFPLSLDDWMPPVDAVYRPHVVHHTIVPPEVKAQQTRSKTKRYFTIE